MNLMQTLVAKGWTMSNIYVAGGRIMRRGRAQLIWDYRGFVRSAKLKA